MSDTLKLHEAIAVRKGIKSRTYGIKTDLDKKIQKPDLFNGLTKEFKPLEDGGVVYPPDSKVVAENTHDILRRARAAFAEFFDIEATLDRGNQSAVSDVVVDGKVVIKDAPVTLLLSLEKEFNDLYTFVSDMPTLDVSKSWAKDPNSHLFRSETEITHKTKKVQKPVVLYPHTPEHPAQTQIVSDDVMEGFWHKTFISGAMPLPEKEILLERIDKLRQAIKRARARANDTEVEKQEIGDAIFAYILG